MSDEQFTELKVWKYSIELTQTSKGQFYVKSIKVKDDAIRDALTSFDILVEEVMDRINKLNKPI